MILLLMGFKKATAQYACVWCTVDKKDRYGYNPFNQNKSSIHYRRFDTCVPDEEYHKIKRTLASIHTDYRNKKSYCCEHLPLLNIETDHILPSWWTTFTFKDHRCAAREFNCNCSCQWQTQDGYKMEGSTGTNVECCHSEHQKMWRSI